MKTSTTAKTASKKATTAISASKKSVRSNAAASKPRAKAKTDDSEETNEATKQTPFEKLFEDLLKDIYWAEQNLVDALQKMCDAATTDELKSAFEDHKYVTQKHVSRLEKAFSMLGIPAEAKKCDAMAGLIKEGERIIEETKEGTMTRDAGLIIAAQKVEHYEIASYGSIVQVALTLGHDDVAKLLEKTLSEEEDADQHLTDIAETDVNPMADEEGEGAEEEQHETTEIEA